jgi:hypothetical protein
MHRMTDLQTNTRDNVLRTLHDFASAERQKNYKNSVPFVEIPTELLAQWDGYQRVRDREWYQNIWSDLELKSLDNFNLKLEDALQGTKHKLTDVPEILQDKKWIGVMQIAEECLKSMNDSYVDQ